MCAFVRSFVGACVCACSCIRVLALARTRARVRACARKDGTRGVIIGVLNNIVDMRIGISMGMPWACARARACYAEVLYFACRILQQMCADLNHTMDVSSRDLILRNSTLPPTRLRILDSLILFGPGSGLLLARGQKCLMCAFGTKRRS